MKKKPILIIVSACILLVGILVLVLSLSNASSIGEDAFNEDDAINESQEQLNRFFEVYEDREIISSMDREELKQTVNESFSDFFTPEFMQQIEQEIETLEIDRNHKNFSSPTVFFMEDNSVDETVKFNQYKFSEENSFIADDTNRTVKTQLVAVGTTQNMFVEVTLEEKEGTWKIADVIKQ